MTQLEQLPARIDDLSSQVQQLRSEMRVEFSAVRADIAEQGTHMRVLHEEVIARIALVQEGMPPAPGLARRKPTRRRG